MSDQSDDSKKISLNNFVPPTRENEIVKDDYLSYNIITNVKGYNASKGKWVEVYLFKKL